MTTTISRVENDGIDHINIWTSGRTELGRMLANFTYCHFDVPGIGPFNSMEGFWWFIKTSSKTNDETKARNKLRSLSGRNAKDTGRNGNLMKITGFKELVRWGMYQKVIQNEKLANLMKESTLPFEMYWLKEDSAMEVYPSGWEWQTEIAEEIRNHLKQGTTMEMPDIKACLAEAF